MFKSNNSVGGLTKTPDRATTDLPNILSPIVVFCSKANNITPPQQALGWILDLYDSVDDIRANGQSIVYTIHETVGHLSIFVSGGVAKQEREEFSSNIELSGTLRPGIYVVIFEDQTAETANHGLEIGNLR